MWFFIASTIVQVRLTLSTNIPISVHIDNF